MCALLGPWYKSVIQLGVGLYGIHNLGPTALGSVYPVQTSTSLYNLYLKFANNIYGISYASELRVGDQLGNILFTHPLGIFCSPTHWEYSVHPPTGNILFTHPLGIFCSPTRWEYSVHPPTGNILFTHPLGIFCSPTH